MEHNYLWLNGRCQRGHDITDPDNIRFTRTNGNVKRLCIECSKVRATAYRNKQRLTNNEDVDYPERVCQQCERIYDIEEFGGKRMSLANWLNRKYCSTACKGKATYQREQLKGENRTNPLPEKELTRLRAIVGFDPSRDVF